MSDPWWTVHKRSKLEPCTEVRGKSSWRRGSNITLGKTASAVWPTRLIEFFKDRARARRLPRLTRFNQTLECVLHPQEFLDLTGHLRQFLSRLCLHRTARGDLIHTQVEQFGNLPK